MPSQMPVAGDRVQRDAAGRQQDADQRGGVLERHRLGGRVGRGEDVLEDADALLTRLSTQLDDGLDPRRALEEERGAQHDVRHHQRLHRLRVHQRVDALVDREAGAEHEDPDRGEQRPEVALHAVAERVLHVGRLLAARERRQQEELVDGVGDRVGSLGEHRRRPGQEPRDDLGDRDREVRPAGDEDGADGAVLVLLPLFSHCWCMPAVPVTKPCAPGQATVGARVVGVGRSEIPVVDKGILVWFGVWSCRWSGLPGGCSTWWSPRMRWPREDPHRRLTNGNGKRSWKVAPETR